jgi:hypothetical protein
MGKNNAMLVGREPEVIAFGCNVDHMDIYEPGINTVLFDTIV